MREDRPLRRACLDRPPRSRRCSPPARSRRRSRTRASGSPGRARATLAPEAPALVDLDAQVLHPGLWLRELAEARTPPSLMALFTVQCVGVMEKGPRMGRYTHGLERCGVIELDIADAPGEGAGLLTQLVNAVGSKFMDGGVAPAGEVFSAGRPRHPLRRAPEAPHLREEARETRRSASPRSRTTR